MKPLGLTLSALILIAMPITAQTPPPAATTQPSPERLDALLQAWESRMSKLDSLSTRATRTDVDPLTKRTKTFVGEAAFMKPNMARIDLTHEEDIGKKDAEKTNFERLICNGNYIYEYSAKEKLIIIHEMPKSNPGDDNMILSFLRGMKAENAKQRFDMVLTKETEWYGYLMITPKHPADKQEFTAAQLTIWMKNPNPEGQPNIAMMPCRLWYRQPNGKEVTYAFSDMRPDAQLEKQSFVPRQIQGYQVQNAGAQAQVTPNPNPNGSKSLVRP